ncbi:ATP-binding protein [Streptomyces somaliensis]|uniref:ATP-binding protein n=1 Tax=Streptomyces somaliensis TaxID=78355 RepID=UPI0020CD31E0|nr:ATP-binding protein [Streptomyces somaliensis]MCP9944675.1 ATP-binding protein [Streptomyces somaliensis]MCP9962104.1 ATP-binding protein [Streptomyces somaliensis]
MTTETHPSGDTCRPPRPVREFRTAFTSTPRGARLARRLAPHRLDAWGHPYGSDTNTTVTPVVAELAANAVTHGRVPGRDFRLRLSLDPAAGLVRVEVTDTRDDRMPPVPPPAPPEPDAESGRGLCLVSALASRWAVVPREGGGPGKTVYAEIDL